MSAQRGEHVGTRVLWLIPVAILLGTHAAYAQQGCESLTTLKLPYTLITSAVMAPEAAAAAPAFPAATAAGVVPAHCDVRGVIRPTADSEIKFALWLPSPPVWNSKYRQEGNGGWAGSINTAGFAEPLRRGYAVAATDNGHEGGGANWAIGHPEKLIDFGYRAVHETSVQSKAILRAYYGRAPERSYFVGCSDGGREALMEAQRYPEDFQGILAGAPANNWSHLFTAFVWNERALLATPDSAIPPAKLAVIQRAVVAACDRRDGVSDGLIENPLACTFDPGVLACKGGDAPDCLTTPQVAALRKIYDGPRNPRTQEQIFVGQPVGTEAVPGGWEAWITPAKAAGAIQFGFGNSYYGAAVFEDPKWDFRTLDFDGDVSLGDAKAGPVLNATNPDLRSFRAGGGRLIQYHGWGDAAIPAPSSIEYYESVRTFSARYPDARTPANSTTEDFYRLFLVPGMAHCGGGNGPNSFGNGASRSTAGNPDRDIFTALERWVERGEAPSRIIGSGTAADDPKKPLTRPLCPYPQVAQYSGSGDVNDALNFACVAPSAR
jgi:feruloyl esterase